MGAPAAAALHRGLRTLAHVTEYAILAVLALCAARAILDAAHQASVPARLGSAWDIALDTAGAAVALCAIRMLRRAPVADTRD